MSNGQIRVVMHGIQGPPGFSSVVAMEAAAQAAADRVQTGLDLSQSEIFRTAASFSAAFAADSAASALSSALYANAVGGGLPLLIPTLALPFNAYGLIDVDYDADRVILRARYENATTFPAEVLASIQTVLPLPLNGYGYITAQYDADRALIDATFENGTQYPAVSLSNVVSYLPLPLNAYGYTSVEYDADRVLLSAVYESGATFPSNNVFLDTSAKPVAYLLPVTTVAGTFNQVFVSTGAGGVQITTSPYNKFSPSVEIVRATGLPYIKFASDSQQGIVSMRCLPNGKMQFIDLGLLDLTTETGQSNGSGVPGPPGPPLLISVTSPYPDSAQTFNGNIHGGVDQTASSVGWNDPIQPADVASLVGITSSISGPTGETNGPGHLNYIQREMEVLLDGHTNLVFGINAIGSSYYDIIRKNPGNGSEIYANGVRMFQAVKDIATATGRKCRHGRFIWKGGEGDEGNGSGKLPDLNLHTELQQLYTDNNADSKLIQADNPDMWMYLKQPSSWARAGNYPVPVTGLLLHLAAAANPKIIFSHAGYMDDFNPIDGIHEIALTQLIDSERFARTRLEVEHNHVVWATYQAISAVRVGNVVTITMPPYFTGQVIDTALVSDPGDYGLEFSDDHNLPFTADSVTDRLTVTAHGMAVGLIHRCYVTSTGTLPLGLIATIPYYARVIDANTVTLHPRQDFAAANTNVVDISSAGTGTHTLHYPSAAISSVAIVNNLIVMTLDKTPTGANQFHSYGYTAYSPVGAITPAGRLTGPRGCIHDNRVSYSRFDGRPLFNHPIHYRIQVT